MTPNPLDIALDRLLDHACAEVVVENENFTAAMLQSVRDEQVADKAARADNHMFGFDPEWDMPYLRETIREVAERRIQSDRCGGWEIVMADRLIRIRCVDLETALLPLKSFGLAATMQGQSVELEAQLQYVVGNVAVWRVVVV